MEISVSERISNLAPYAFAEIDALVAKLRAAGRPVYDFGVGDPTTPTPNFVINEGSRAMKRHRASGYPSYIGESGFRAAAANYLQREFGVKLDPETQITSSLGSKEAVFNFPLAFVDRGDVVICPTPGYPPYKNGTRFAGGEVYFLPLLAENNFLMDFNSVPQNILKRTKLIWINYPNSPTGKVAPREWLEDLVAWAHHNNIIIAADEGCYIELYNQEPRPISILEITTKGVIAFYSLSKRSNMTGWRVGFCAGDAQIIAAFKKVKTNIDSGTPKFVQEAAAAALNDTVHVALMRREYSDKMRLLVATLNKAGISSQMSEATFYLWQKAPAGYTGVTFAKKLAENGIVVTPGAWISDPARISAPAKAKNKVKVTKAAKATKSLENYNNFQEVNPGENYVRFSLVPSRSDVVAACRILSKILISF
jgi:LL-diaminopimelate aminotransferase